MSAQLVDSFAGDFDPSEFTDDYQEQLRTLIEAKLEQGERSTPTRPSARSDDDEERRRGGEVIDLMEALRRSVERSRSARRRRPAKKPAAKKTAAKKAPDKEKEPSRRRRLRSQL